MRDEQQRVAAGPRAGRREWIGLAVLALPTLLVSLDMSVLFLALPHLAADLGAGGTEQLWILDMYGFMVAGFLVTMGTLGDRIGRRKLLLIGAAAFTLASVLAAYATSPATLIAARAVLGVAGATLMPSTLALITNMFRDAHQRGVAIAVWMSCFMVGTAIGPIVGGALLELFWWGSVFLLAVPVMVLLLAVAPALLPEYRDPRAGRLDLTSVALSLAAILPVVYGLKELAKDGVGTLPVLAIAAGVGVGALFVRRQRRVADPLLDLSLFSSRSFSAALVIMFGGGVVMAGTFLFIPQYLQMVEGLSPLRAGLWLVPGAMVMIVSTQMTPHLARRFRPATIMAAALAVGAAGFALVTQSGAADGPIVLVVGFALASAGIAPPHALGTGLILGSAPPEKAGSASSVVETTGDLGIALGMATLGSVGTAVYRAGFAVPAGVPSGVGEAARESLSAATAVATELSTPLATELLDSARAAFTTGMHTVAGLGGLLFAVLALIALTLLRQRPPAGAEEAAQPGAAGTPGKVGEAAGEPA